MLVMCGPHSFGVAPGRGEDNVVELVITEKTQPEGTGPEPNAPSRRKREVIPRVFETGLRGG